MDLLLNWHRRGQLVQNMIFETQATTQSETDNNAAAVSALSSQLAATQAKAVQDLEEQSLKNQALMKEQADASQHVLEAAERREAELVARLKAKDRQIKAAKDRLQEMEQTKATGAQKRAAMFEQLLKQRPRKSSAADRKVLDVMEMYDSKVSSLEKHIAVLEAQVRALTTEDLLPVAIQTATTVIHHGWSGGSPYAR